jgi:hypothetical protein
MPYVYKSLKQFNNVYKSFIIRCLGVLAPFLCLVRTFRAGFHSAQLSKVSK